MRVPKLVILINACPNYSSSGFYRVLPARCALLRSGRVVHDPVDSQSEAIPERTLQSNMESVSEFLGK
jgi:hypothetical protein